MSVIHLQRVPDGRLISHVISAPQERLRAILLPEGLVVERRSL